MTVPVLLELLLILSAISFRLLLCYQIFLYVNHSFADHVYPLPFVPLSSAQSLNL